MADLAFIAGKRSDDPEAVHFWIDQHRGSVALVAQHTRGGDQRLAFIYVDSAGQLTIELPNLFDLQLCQALGVQRGEAIRPNIIRHRPKPPSP